MALKNWAYVYLCPGFDPKTHTSVVTSSECRFTAVGMDFSQKENVIDVAKALVCEGVQMIELCGGFGPLWIAKVSEAVGGEIPIGSTAYGPEARRSLLEILS